MRQPMRQPKILRVDEANLKDSCSVEKLMIIFFLLHYLNFTIIDPVVLVTRFKLWETGNMEMTFSSVIADHSTTSVLVLVASLLIFLWFRRNGSRIRLPPGPFRVPYVGSVTIIPDFMSNKKRHQLLIDLARRYGNIFSLAVGQLNVVFLNDMETIKEAFVTKSDVISDRTSEKAGSILGVSGEFEKYAGLGIAEANFTKAFKERKRLALQSMKEFGFGGVSMEVGVSRVPAPEFPVFPVLVFSKYFLTILYIFTQKNTFLKVKNH